MKHFLSAFCVVLVVVLVIAYQKSTCTTLSKPLGTLHFDCYVINMPGDKDRMHGFTIAYGKTDLAKTHGLIRHEATVGKNIQIAEYTSSKALCEILRAERNSYRQKHYELTRGAVGCWLSHRNLWHSILSTDKDCALIFEDDCVMAKNIRELLLDSQVPADWDLCLLGYVCNECDEMTCADAIHVNRFFGLHCYMIRRRGIEKILANPKMKEITKQIDSVLGDMIRDGELNVYALPEPIAWQNNKDYKTTIQMEMKKVKGVDEWE
jgi:hypothetical protein